MTIAGVLHLNVEEHYLEAVLAVWAVYYNPIAVV